MSVVLLSGRNKITAPSLHPIDACSALFFADKIQCARYQFHWLFLFALLYHTIKKNFLPVLHYFDQFCSFWTFYRFRGGTFYA